MTVGAVGGFDSLSNEARVLTLDIGKLQVKEDAEVDTGADADVGSTSTFFGWEILAQETTKRIIGRVGQVRSG